MSAELRFIDAIHAGLQSALADDDAVVVIGEDVTYGGPFGATKGLAEEFGRHRVRDTPISEATVMGMATGAAITGLRPVVEVMFVDFITLAMDQLINHAAKLHFMSGGQLRVPLTVRVQGGVRGRFGAHHSQSLESWFTHTPGLKVAAPAFPGDARALLVAAIADDNPVIYLEHRGLYWDKGPLHDDTVDGALVRRPGTDVTIVSYSKMVHSALAAASCLADSGVEAEVIDLRWLAPLDTATVLESVARTGRAVVAHEAVSHGGLGAEIAATIQREVFTELLAPVARVGAAFAPVAAAAGLEDAFLPGVDEIESAAGTLMAFGPPPP